MRPVRRCLLVRLVAWRHEADPVTAVRIVIVRPLLVHLASGRLPARRLGVSPQLRVRPLLQSANGSTPLVAGTVFLAASVSRAHLARSRLCARAQVGVRVVGDGEVTVAAEKRVQRPRSERPLPTGIGFVGAGGGPPWAQFASPRPLPAPRDLAVSSHRARAYALLPPMKEVPTATLARLWSLAASLQSLERILQESFDSMPDRVAVFPEAIDFLELCGFEKDAQEEHLVMPAEKAIPEILNVAGQELHAAIYNPFFGVF
ncbi:unnamed protein product [Closterium sp. NIES-65]|nr:unnamed protein product [Closterium sp. NIES-65]